MRIRTIVCGVVAALVLPAMVRAQNAPLSTILPNVFLSGVTMTSGSGTAGNPHEAHFIASLGLDSAPFQMNRLIASQVNTFPIASSSGGFVFTFDPATGLFKPASQSFGSGFAERALTNGRRRVGFGLNYQHVEFKSYEGVDLKNGNLAFVLQHNDCCPPVPGSEDPFFEGDLVKMSLSLQVKNDVVAPFLSYGLTNRWDVGIVVPIVHLTLAPTVTSTIDRVATASNVLIHSWDGLGGTSKISSLLGTASGIGDIVLRTKYRFVDAGAGGIAAGLDVRVPSGDKDNLLGTGAVQTKLLFIASGEFGRVAPHVNAGYTFSRGDLASALTTLPSETQPANAATQAQINSVAGISLADLKVPDEINYVAGVDIAAHSLLTISGDFVGVIAKRWLFRTVRPTKSPEIVSSECAAMSTPAT